jgi:phosphohistidine phosphatase SixA
MKTARNSKEKENHSMENDSVVTTVILIRHAERDNSTATDPHLNAEGIARAQSLVHVMNKAEIKAIYTSNFIRTKETANLLATHLGISPVQIAETAALKTHILENHSGKTVLVIGHSNTVPELIGLLGGAGVFTIGDNEFDNLFVLTNFSLGITRTTQLKYGNPS